MAALPPQPRHPLDQPLGVPHLDLLDADPHLDRLADQPRRHRVQVVPHLNRAAPVHPHPRPLGRLQPTRRQPAQRRTLGRERRRPPRVPPPHQRAQERLVVPAAGELAAAPQHQRLVHRLLEPPVALLAVAVLVAAVGVRRLRRHAVMTHQPAVARRELLRPAVRMHRQRHPIRPVTRRHAAQRPPGVLQALAQTRKALRKAHAHVLPVRVRQHEVMHQVVERLTRDRHSQTAHVGKVRRAQSPRFVHLREEHFLGRPVRGLPGAHPTLEGPPHPVRVLPGMRRLEPTQQRDRLQPRLAHQLLLDLRPHRRQRVRPRPPRPRPPPLAGQRTRPPVFTPALAIHPGLHRRRLQRRPLMQPEPQPFHLRIGHATDGPHRQLPSSELPLSQASNHRPTVQPSSGET